MQLSINGYKISVTNQPFSIQNCKAGHYKHDLNPDNPLGMKGEVAEAYGNLIEKLWSGTTSSLAPREFKVNYQIFGNLMNVNVNTNEMSLAYHWAFQRIIYWVSTA